MSGTISKQYFDGIAAAAAVHGVSAKLCSEYHIQLHGPRGAIVDFWPTAKGGGKAHLPGTKAKVRPPVSAELAIKLAATGIAIEQGSTAAEFVKSRTGVCESILSSVAGAAVHFTSSLSQNDISAMSAISSHRLRELMEILRLNGYTPR